MALSEISITLRDGFKLNTFSIIHFVVPTAATYTQSGYLDIMDDAMLIIQYLLRLQFNLLIHSIKRWEMLGWGVGCGQMGLVLTSNYTFYFSKTSSYFR